MKDTIISVGVVLFFASFVTAHLVTVVRLSWRPPRWRALAAFAVFPLAPWFALRERMRVLAIVWLFCLAGYGLALLLAQ